MGHISSVFGETFNLDRDCCGETTAGALTIRPHGQQAERRAGRMVGHGGAALDSKSAPLQKRHELVALQKLLDGNRALARVKGDTWYQCGCFSLHKLEDGVPRHSW